MDPFTGIGLVANILQFVDYVCHVLKIGRQIRRDGLVESNQELEQTAKVLEHQVARILSDQEIETGLNESDKALKSLADECASIGRELLGFIDKFKVDRDSGPLNLTKFPQQRAKHEKEVALEQEIILLASRIDEFDKVVAKKRAVLKMNEEEKRRQLEQKRKQFGVMKTQIEEMKERLKKQAKLCQEEVELNRLIAENQAKLRPDEVEVNRLIAQNQAELRRDKIRLSRLIAENQAKLRQDEIELNQLRDGNQAKLRLDEGGLKQLKDENLARLRRDETELSRLITENQAKLRPDEVDLIRLRDSKREKENKLKRVTEREDSIFDKMKRKAEKENGDLTRRATTRKGLHTLKLAIQFEWDKPKIEQLERRLEKVRSLLSSEVMLNMQRSLRAQTSHLRLMDDEAGKRHDAVLQAIDSLAISLKQSPFLFPTLPRLLIQVDPSFESAALTGYSLIEDAVLAALYFRKMDARETQVHEAYPDTCSWIFQDPADRNMKQPWSNFRSWLEAQDNCYWVEGKAGCGKSTLMKFLYSDPRTLAALRRWAGDSCELITASFFCWRSGTPLQMNQEGLLRSLLHTILKQKRDLISRVFPHQYSVMTTRLFADNTSPDVFFLCDSPGCSNSFERPGQLAEHQKQHHATPESHTHQSNDSCGTLTLTELKTAFMTLARQNLKGFKICLFIDGLDEYIGDQLEIVNLFKSVVSQSSAIKAVISSRPESVFFEAFRHCPQLQMELFTARDIRLYIRSHLLSHSRMNNHEYQSSQLVERLLGSISRKACGVFLWVFLVVRLLLECLSDGAYPEELESITDEYPEELRELYKHMFSRMKPLHRTEAFRLFQTIHHAQAIESRIPSALRLSFMERYRPDTALSMPLQTLTMDELKERLSLFEDRLRSRCCGLFEVKYTGSLHSSSEVSHIPEGNVVFLHRTVSDFLNDEDIRDVMEQETRDITHQIYKGLMASILYSFKCWRFCRLTNKHEWRKFIQEIASFFFYCQLSQSMTGSDQSRFIDEFDKELRHFWQVRNLESRSKAVGLALGNYDFHWAESVLIALGLKQKGEPDENPLITLAARYGLSDYVRERLREPVLAESISHKKGSAWGRLLMLRVCTWAMQRSSLRLQYFEIIEMLLASELQFNAYGQSVSSARATTLWQEILSIPSTRCAHLEVQRVSPPTAELGEQQEKVEVSEMEMLDVWAQLVQVFVKFGASVDRNFNTKASQQGGKAATARGKISAAMAALRRRSGLSSEDLLAQERTIARLEQLLADEPPPTDEAGPTHHPIPERADTQPATSLAHSGGGDPNTVTQRKNRWSKTAKKAQANIEKGETDRRAATADPPVGCPAISTGDHPCARCNTIDMLAEIGFSPSQALQAIAEAGVGNDVSALTSWILDNNIRDTEAQGSQNTKLLGQYPPPSRALDGSTTACSTANETKSPNPGPVQEGSLLSSREKQWRIVASVPSKNTNARGANTSSVVGAEYVLKPPKTKRRRPGAISRSAAATATEHLAANGTGDTTLFSEAGRTNSSAGPSASGAIELGQGTFTWFFEGRGEGPFQRPVTLTGEQTRRLEEFLVSMGC